LKVLAIIITVVNGDCDTLSTESSRTTNSVQVVLRVTDPLVSTTAYSLCGYVEIDNDLNFWHVDTSCKHIGSDDDADFSSSEFFYHFITLLMAHITKNDGRLQVFASQCLMQTICVRLGIDKDNRLCHLANIEDFFDKLRFLSLLASVLELLDMVQG